MFELPFIYTAFLFPLYQEKSSSRQLLPMKKKTKIYEICK